MSRLVISKTEERTLCIIKNFGSIELEGNNVKIIDKYGLTEVNIFSLHENVYQVNMLNFNIFSSNAYSIHNGESTKYWYVSHVALNEIRSLFDEHYIKQFEISISKQCIKLGDLNLTYIENNRFQIEKDNIVINDNILNFINPRNFHDNEFAMLFNNNYIYVSKDSNSKKVALRIINKDEVVNMYALFMCAEYVVLMQKFITKCLDLHLEEKK